ncbi:MAG: epoxyqueuosine reductase QueH [Candidatus Omnitrophica bacterium]|nr:epoxyqueuosine reductase QueH [Candidatus Omnitrophota bacterium]
MNVLLHICCAVCASACVEKLRQEGHRVCGFFYNPNIHPPGEYLKRLHETEEVARKEGFSLIIGDYNVHNWSVRTTGLEDEAEGGKRCLECFGLRLENTARLAREKGFDAFTTTLTISPHKNSQAINEIGRNISDELFLVRDFKKKDGFKRAQELARKYSLYHQNYCGCIYSLNERQKNGRIQKSTCSLRTKSPAS